MGVSDVFSVSLNFPFFYAPPPPLGPRIPPGRTGRGSLFGKGSGLRAPDDAFSRRVRVFVRWADSKANFSRVL